MIGGAPIDELESQTADVVGARRDVADDGLGAEGASHLLDHDSVPFGQVGHRREHPRAVGPDVVGDGALLLEDRSARPELAQHQVDRDRKPHVAAPLSHGLQGLRRWRRFVDRLRLRGRLRVLLSLPQCLHHLSGARVPFGGILGQRLAQDRRQARRDPSRDRPVEGWRLLDLLQRVAITESPWKGTRPVKSSKITTPRA